MRVLYVAPRYHTNQTAIMKGWLSRGDEVCFLAQYAGKLEDYTIIKPKVIGYSSFFILLNNLYIKIIKRTNEYAINMRLRYGFPPVGKLYLAMKKFSPDVVITRERSVYSIVVTILCRINGWPVILYNQSPLMEESKKDILHRIMYNLTPKYRITPVYRSKKNSQCKDPNAFFLPFLMEPHISPEDKEYFLEGYINLLCIGKYQKRKNHLLMIEVVERLATKYPIRLNIAGEVSDSFQEDYYKTVQEHLKEHHMGKIVTLYKDLTQAQVFELYKKADLFILPSSEEPAAVSPLEAMSFSLPVISGDDNGTATYIEEGKNGYIFADKDAADLYNKIELIISDKRNIQKMGRKSFELVIEKHQFENYYQTITDIVQQINN